MAVGVYLASCIKFFSDEKVPYSYFPEKVRKTNELYQKKLHIIAVKITNLIKYQLANETESHFATIVRLLDLFLFICVLIIRVHSWLHS